ncbi:unnamed protein product [Mucor hiemalis]
MTSLQTLIYAPRSIALISNGLFSGLGISLSFVGVPAIKASRDPLPSFIKTYNNGHIVAIFNILVGTISNATKENRFLYASILTFLSVPITAILIMPVNNQLFALQKLGDDYDRVKVQALLTKWNKFQTLRTISGTAAFVINVLYK